MSPPAPPDPAQVLEQETLSAALTRAIDALPARRREVVILARYHDLSYKEVAEVMGVSVQTVANQLSSALATLRDTLAGQRR